MIFQNIDFHNVEEIESYEGGYRMWRVPAAVRDALDEGGADVSMNSTGVELRFRIRSEEATVILRAQEAQEAQVAYIYYGSFQGGWQYSTKIIGTKETRITIPRGQNAEVLRQLTAEKGLGFQPDVVRIVLPYVHCFFLGIEGEVEPPNRSDVPGKTYLAYGSSITHGSLALGAPYTYPFRISQILNMDYCNLGYAGSARLEKGMAEYLVSRKDWDIASVEMGINMLYTFSEEAFEERVKQFTDILASDTRPVFVTSIFGFAGAGQEKAARFREIVRRHSQGRLIYTDGTDLLNNPVFVSADLVHPSLEGVAQIAQRWSGVMKEELARLS